jgi:hypothetical protein
MRSNQSQSPSALRPEPVRRNFVMPASISATVIAERNSSSVRASNQMATSGVTAGLPGAKTLKMLVSSSQPVTNQRRGGARYRSVSTAWGIPSSRAVKLGRYNRFAWSTCTTTAAGLPCLVIVVASPCSAASITADREAFASRKRSVLTSFSVVTTCSYMGSRSPTASMVCLSSRHRGRDRGSGRCG